MSIKKLEICEGINLYLLPEDKFKTFILGAFINTPLTKDTAARNALLPRILASKTANYKSKKEINLKLDELYGSRLSFGVAKQGEAHIISIMIDAVSGAFTNDDNQSETAKLLGEILVNPFCEGECFDKEVVVREKDVVKNAIESIINDKRQYAVHRCIEEMCHDEAYGIGKYGTVEDVERVDAAGLYFHYKNIIQSAPVDFIAAGAFNEDEIVNLVKEISEKLGARTACYAKTLTEKETSEVKYVKEEADVSQGKLVLGFRTNISPDSEKSCALMVYNGILGGSPASKLFNNVREKMSLCYYASSSLDREKGIMVAQAGIDCENYQKALDAILKQHEDIKDGAFTDEEFEFSKAAIINALLSYKDDVGSMTAFYSSKFGKEKIDSLDEMCKKIAAVKKEDIVPVANRIKLDTVYFLCGRAEGK